MAAANPQKKIAWALTIFGFVPFAALAVALWYVGKLSGFHTILRDAFEVYAAVILSFLGGIRWGLAIAERDRPHLPSGAALVISVLPSIVAWVAVLLPGPYSIIVLLIAFAAQGAYDSFTVEGAGAPDWFPRLRITITFLVAIAHLAALFAVL